MKTQVTEPVKKVIIQVITMDQVIHLVNKVLIQIIRMVKKNKYTYYGFFPFINLDFNVLPNTLSGFHKLLFGILIISISLLWCFINIVGYLSTLYFIKYTNLEGKYPKIKPFLTYFNKMNHIYLIIETIYFILTLLSVIGICVHLLFFT